MWQQGSGSRSVSMLVGASVLVLMSAGCDWILSGTEDFTIRVDNIEAPATISTSDTLIVRFLGTVGPNGCYRLVRVDKGVSPSVMQLRFHGERRDGNCTQAVVDLEHEERLLPPHEPALFTIRVLQPDGPPLERTVRVE